MISQLQNIQAFFARDLTDIIEWGKHVRVDPDQKTTGDQAYIVVATDLNRYKLSVASAYIDPPPGAPLACKSLGTVSFYDPVGPKTIVGPKADATYAEISKHLHVRELTDALALAQREVAEAPPENAGPARVKYNEIAARAQKWGLAAGPKAETLSPHRDAGVGLPLMAATLPPDLTTVPDYIMTGPRPFIGAPVIFITNPGEEISGMGEIPGVCVKTFASADRISMFMTPDHSEPCYRDNLPRRGSPAGNGKSHQFNCWDFNPHFVREQKRINELEESVARLSDELKSRSEAEKPKVKGKARESELIS